MSDDPLARLLEHADREYGAGPACINCPPDVWSWQANWLRDNLDELMDALGFDLIHVRDPDSTVEWAWVALDRNGGEV